METSVFEAKLAALQNAFRERVQSDANELERLLVENRSGNNITRIQHLAHRLAGGASTFGLPNLTGPAGRLEAEIINGGNTVSELTAALIAEIRTTVPAKFIEGAKDAS